MNPSKGVGNHSIKCTPSQTPIVSPRSDCDSVVQPPKKKKCRPICKEIYGKLRSYLGTAHVDVDMKERRGGKVSVFHS